MSTEIVSVQLRGEGEHVRHVHKLETGFDPEWWTEEKNTLLHLFSLRVCLIP